MDVSVQGIGDRGQNRLFLAYFWPRTSPQTPKQIRTHAVMSVFIIYKVSMSQQYRRHQSCVFGILGWHLLILAYFQPIFGPANPHIPQKRCKGILVHQSSSYMTIIWVIYAQSVYQSSRLIIFFVMKNIDFSEKKKPGTDLFFNF